MATVGIVGGRTVGDPFADRPRSFAKRTIAAVFRDTISRNREPADQAPISPRRYHGSTAPVHDFGFDAQPARVNAPATVTAATPMVPVGFNAATRRGRVV